MKRALFLIALLCAWAIPAWAAPGITVSASGVSILGTSQPISITVTLLDPNLTGNLRVAGTGVIPIMQASSTVPGTTTTVGPIYGNDVIVDGFGNVNGTYYKVQVFTVTNGIIASTPSLQNFYAFTGSGTVDLSTATPLAPSFMTGTNGSVIVQTLNGVTYVGGALASFWGGGDIGSQINAAYAALPSTGGFIYILPNPGGCYTQTTTVNLTTLNKPFVLQMIGQSTSLGTSGSCINWPATTGTAYNVDIVPSAVNGFSGGVGFRDFTLTNNNCTTNGGCGSSAIGIQVGVTQGGLRNGRFDNVNITGFGKGIQFSDSGGVGWGNVFTGGNISYNTTGVNDAVGHENDTYIGVKFLDNQTGLNVLGDVTLVGGSLDANLTTGVNLTGNAILYTTDVHWENNGPANIQYVTGTASTAVFMKGGIVLDDTSGGSSSQSFFSFGIGSITGLDMFGGVGGRTYSAPAVNCQTRCSVNLYNGNATAWPSMNSICSPFTCTPFAINAQAPFTNAFQQTLTGSFVGIGLVTNSSLFILRDETAGGTVLATVDNATTNVVLSGAAGAGSGATFVVGAAGANQIGLQYSSGSLQIEGNGTTVGHVIRYTQILMH